MTDLFKEKGAGKKGKKVRYLGTCTFYDIHATNFDTNFHDIMECIKCESIDTHEVLIIPILSFLNYFEPVDKPITDAISVLDNILNAEDERHQKDFCTLHSRESETNEERPTEGVQE